MSSASHLSSLSLAILGLVARSAKTGYDLRKLFSTTPMGHFSASPGAIYPALERLEKQGWIRGRIENKGSLRPRRQYCLSSKGRTELERHVRKPVTREDLVWHVDALMLRFTILGDVFGADATLPFLDSLIREANHHVRWLEEFTDGEGGESSLFGRLALDQGIGGYAALARWAAKAKREIENETKS